MSFEIWGGGGYGRHLRGQDRVLERKSLGLLWGRFQQGPSSPPLINQQQQQFSNVNQRIKAPRKKQNISPKLL